MLHSLKAAKRTAATLAILSAFALLVLNSACKIAGGNNAAGNASNVNSNGAAGETSATPPFQTKEPERYQARMVLTFSLAGHRETSETLINREGDKRREDYEPVPGLKVSDLLIPAGHFLLLPARKLYAEVSSDTSGYLPGPQMTLPEDFSPDRLINESRTEALYEKLGVEELNGRSVTKYRVKVVGPTLEKQGTTSEQLIWIDEAFGMPVRSENILKSDGQGEDAATYTMEMLDLKQEADQSSFALPQDYKKVSAKEIMAQVTSSKTPARPTENEEKGAVP